MKIYKYIYLLCLVALQSAGIIVAQNTMQQPVDIGNKAFSFSYTDTKNTLNYTNNFQPQYRHPSNDVYYKFTLTRAMDISIDHCGSGVSDTYLYVLNSSGGIEYSNDDDWEYEFCINPYNSYLYLPNLPAGTYYVVSEGYSQNGDITTTIQGICPLPSSGLYDGCAVTSPANSGQNYILSVTPTVATSDVSGLGVNESLQTVQYFDGLGRPIQTVQRGITPTKQDLATLTEYDGAGREWKQWLPIPTTGNGAFTPFSNFESVSPLYSSEGRPYNEAIIEPSPLNRVLGNKGPGAAWENKPTVISYKTNSDADNIAYFYVNASKNLVRGANYASGTLYKTVSKDEDGKTVEEYKDKLEQVVLKRSKDGTQNVDTYFVNNDLGQLAFVLPPLAADVLKAFTINTPITDDETPTLKQYCYLYQYDERGNCIYKRLPGCEPINMVYDQADRLVLSQDGNQKSRTPRQWSITKYDILGRVLYTGVINREVSDAEKNIIHDNVIVESAGTTNQLTNTGYTCNTFVNEIAPLTVNYYDNYNFLSALPTTLAYQVKTGYDKAHPVSATTSTELNAKGLMTGTRTYILDGSGTYIATAMYYDYRGRVVQTRSTNHLGGRDITCSQYNFSGQVTKSLKENNIAGQDNISELYTNDYDHAGRLLKSRYKINDKPEVILNDLTEAGSYDELGRLRKKKRHNGIDPEEYDYNIRNWPTRIKSGAFEEKLYYNTRPSHMQEATPCFNGNICATTWTYNNNTNGYQYNYDNLNRYTWGYAYINNVLQVDYQWSESFNYDKQGNIKHLYRFDGIDLIDQLTLTYNGNQLKNVCDDWGSRNQYNIKEYQDKAQNYQNTSVEEMSYDANGNLIRDLDRDIVTIKYNLLNLPEIIQFKNGNQIRNIYDAGGQKLSTRNITIAYYITQPIISCDEVYDLNDMVQDNEEIYIDFIDKVGNVEHTHSESYYLGDNYNYGYETPRVYNNEGYSNLGYSYSYYRKDHLGNNREVWRAPYTVGSTNYAATTTQRTQYYPSGMPWASNMGDNPWEQHKKYNGKEFVEMHGLDEYYYVFRNYYASTMRFNTVDPLAELTPGISPYAYCFNNPVRFIDPLGLTGQDTSKDIYGRERFDSFSGMYIPPMDRPGGMTAQGYGNSNYGYFQEKLVGFSLSNEWSVHWKGYSSYHSEGIAPMYQTEWVWYSQEEKMYGMPRGGGNNWFKNSLVGFGFTQGAVSTGNSIRNFIEMTYVNELRLDRARTGDFSRPINHQLRSIKNTGKVLKTGGGVLIGADIVMSGEIKVSHGINAIMIGISGSGVGAFIGGAWFVLDYGMMGINLLMGNGATGFGDIIDNALGKYGKYEMYEGVY